MRTSSFFALIAAASLCACSSSERQSSQQKPGSDRDPHGCIASAGYSWCAKTKQCERPWELAERKSFERTKKAFDNFCQVPGGGT